MVSKFIGIMLGIALGNHIGSSTPLALASFSAVTGLHMYCNFKSYQSIQLRTLNPYRACKFLTINMIPSPVMMLVSLSKIGLLFYCLLQFKLSWLAFFQRALHIKEVSIARIFKSCYFKNAKSLF